MDKRLKLTFSRKLSFGIFIFILIDLIYIISMGLIDSINGIDNLRYFAMILGILYFYFKIIKSKININRVYGFNMHLVVVLTIILYILSYLQAKRVHMNLGARTYVQLMLVLLPALYSFGVINYFDSNTLNKLMKTTLIICVIGYFISIDIFSVINTFSVNYLNPFYEANPFENSIFSDWFLYIYIYFVYYKNTKIDGDSKSIKKCTLVSFIMTLLCLKRLAMFFSIIIFIINRLFNYKKRIKSIYIFLLTIIITFLVKYYTLFMQGKLIIPGIDLYKFSTGRNYILSLWAKYNYLSYGYGSSYELIHRYLEMDMVQIYLEVGMIAVFFYILTYLFITNGNLFSIIIMLYSIFNMIFASSIPSVLPSSFLLIDIALFSSLKEDNEHQKTKKHKRRLVFKI